MLQLVGYRGIQPHIQLQHRLPSSQARLACLTCVHVIEGVRVDQQKHVDKKTVQQPVFCNFPDKWFPVPICMSSTVALLGNEVSPGQSVAADASWQVCH